jgi:hypothetical protein
MVHAFHSPDTLKLQPKLEAHASKLLDIQQQAKQMVEGLTHKLEGGDSIRKEGDAAVEKDDFQTARDLYDKAAQAFRDAISTECGSMGTRWLAAKRPDHMRWGSTNKQLKTRDREIVWKGGDGSAVATLGDAITEGRVICEVRLTVHNTRNEDASFFVGVVKSEDLDLAGFWYDDAYAQR